MSNTIVEANKILLRRKNKLIVGNVGYVMSDDTQRYLVTMTKNIETLGYTFSNQLFNKLKTLTKEELFEFYKELVSELKKNIGADVQYNPMYPNFPESVMEENEMQLYMNAIIHYWSYGTILPCEEKNERLPLFDETKVKVIDSGEWEDLYEIFDNLCRSKTSISQTDKEDLEWIMKNSNVKFPDEIPLKENVALIGKIYVESNPLATADKLQKLFKTATDVLRLITAMSDGDISLATNTKYRSFKRKERRLLLELLDNCGNIQEDMLRYKNRWIRVGERLHPGEYKTGRYDNARLAFDKLRNNEKIQTFNSKVDHNMKDKNFEKAILLLQKRPGELARRLDYLLRTVDKKNNVINTFKDVANKVSTPVLLQIKEHFKSRQEELNTRVFFPKGCLARSYAIENKLPDIDKKYCDAIVKICENALIETYKSKDFMGNVYLSEEYKNYIVPFSQRSASKSLKTIVRGSRIKLKESAKAMRAFIWWTNTDDERVDIDLSATVFDENWNYINHVSYTRLRDDEMYIYHSGDIINGASIHNVSILTKLDLQVGDTITVYKSNQIIPQIRENLSAKNRESSYIQIPSYCPVCGHQTEIIKDNDTEILMCANPSCKGKLLGRLSHFVSKKGMDIDGLSDETLKKFIELGWAKNISDIYNLPTHFNELSKMNGFGKKSVVKLQTSIEQSKTTDLQHFIAALSIPNIGTSQSKELCKTFKTWDDFSAAGFGNYDFSQLEGFGAVLNSNIHTWFDTMYKEDQIDQLARNITFTENENSISTEILKGKTFVITGSLEHYKNREELKSVIERNGGKVSGSISKNTFALINNNINSTSSKNKKANSLGVQIISEEDFIQLISK